MLYEAFRRYLPNPGDAPVILDASKLNYDKHNIYNRFEKYKHGKKDSAVIKNICNWSKRIHKTIFEVARWDHVVYKELSSRSIIGKTVPVLVVLWKDNELLRELFQSISTGGTDQDTVPKTTGFASSVHSSILRTEKGMNSHWWYIFGPRHSGSILVYNSSIHCLVLKFTMSLLDPCRNEISFLFDRYNFVC